jgi:hypothetical protein
MNGHLNDTGFILSIKIPVLNRSMSRTHRKVPYGYPHRNPKTLNELKQVRVSNDYYDSEYPVSTRKRYIPTAWDDLLASSYLQTDFKV